NRGFQGEQTPMRARAASSPSQPADGAVTPAPPSEAAGERRAADDADGAASDGRSGPGSRERYRRLPTGAHGLAREEVERDQRERLQRAMTELIAARGYQAVRILDLTKLAHVSRPTFYELY